MSSHRVSAPALKLNPGQPRRRGPSCLCLTWTALACTLLFALPWGIHFIYSTIFFEHHPTLVPYERKAGQPYDLATIVQPLIDHTSRFDILVTVWRREPFSESIPRADAEGIHDVPVYINRQGNEETPVYQGTLFKNITLKDRNLHTTVKYRIPTKQFEQQVLTNYDLRASFVLVPHSPSLLDHVLNYTTCYPYGLRRPPPRTHDVGTPLTMRDEVLDSFSASVPLVAFYDVASSCPSTKKEGIDEDEEPSTKTKLSNHKSDLIRLSDHQSTADEPVANTHPYVITRTFLYVMDTTKVYEEKVYKKAQNQARQDVDCGQGSRSRPSFIIWTRCIRSVLTVGLLETLLRLRVPADEISGGTETQWAYAPYMSCDRAAYGPKDLIPVPVNREKCGDPAFYGLSKPVADFIDVNWNIAFSGRSPKENSIALWSDLRLHDFNMTASEDVINDVQHAVERAQGLKGHQLRHDIHPRRSMVVYSITSALEFSISILNIFYWAFLTSTTGISIPGTALIAISGILRLLFLTTVMVLLDVDKKSHMSRIIFKVLLSIPINMELWLIIRGISPIQIEWKRSNGSIPTISIAEATHSERASRRMKGQVTWGLGFMIYVGVCAICYFANPETMYIIKARGQPNAQGAGAAALIHDVLLPTFSTTAMLVGQAMQLWFNACSRTFAGTYRVVAWLLGVQTLLSLFNTFSGSSMGNAEIRKGFSVSQLVELVIVQIGCYQAWRYRKVLPEADEE